MEAKADSGNVHQVFVDSRGNIDSIKILMQQADTGLFSEKYRVIAVEAKRLTIKGLITGTVLTITNTDPGIPLTPEEFPPGQLLVLSDPAASVPN